MTITRCITPDCLTCESPVRFELFGDKMPQGVSVDLATILVCLSLAEQAGHIPPIDSKWWSDMSGHLQLEIPSIDSIPMES